MTTHTLACALCSSNPHSGQSWLAVFIGFLIVSVGGIIYGNHEQKRKKAGLPPREPSNLSPAMASLLSGRNVASYTAPVRAVTPRGVAVTQGRCCVRGHQSPQQAVDHAAAIGQRIAVSGR